MKSRTFVPGAIATPAAITIPADAPDIEAVVTAQIIRMPGSFTIPSHAVHQHPNTFASAALVGGDLAAVQADHATAARHTITNADNAAAQAHGASVGASPVVAAVPTRLTTRTISLNVNTVLGDLLTLSYLERGERILAS